MKLGVIVLSDDVEELKGLLEGLSEGAEVVEIPAKSGKKPAPKAEPKEDALDDSLFDDDEAEEVVERTPEELKTILTKVRDELGAEKVKEILTAHGAKNLKELVADESNIGTAYAAAEELLRGEVDLDDEDDDLFGDDLDGGDDDLGEAPDAETVKELCQKYARKHGKEKATDVLKAAGLNTVRGLKSASDEQLAKIYAKVKVMEG